MAQAILLGAGGNEFYHDLIGDGTRGNGPSSADLSGVANNVGAVDNGFVVLDYKSLVIPQGQTLRCTQRNCGMIIRVQHDCTINGTIQNIYAPRTISNAQQDALNFSKYYPTFIIGDNASNGGAGNRAGAGFGPFVGYGGDGQAGRFYGGGYSGGGGGGFGIYVTSSSNERDYQGGTGGSAAGITTSTSIFVGAPAAGNRSSGNTGSYGGGGSGACGWANKVSGVQCYASVGGSGAGGRGGNSQSYAFGSWHDYGNGGGGGAGNYGGGVIIIYCGGNLTIGSTGVIDVHGSAGGGGGSNIREGSTGSDAPNGAAGGTGGGGRVFLLYNKSFTNNGSINISPYDSSRYSKLVYVYSLKQYKKLLAGT